MTALARSSECWTHAYSFLQDLEANFAVPLETARMGSLVKFDALVQFLDLKIVVRIHVGEQKNPFG